MDTYYVGYDIGSSSVKVSLVHSDSGKSIVSTNEPKNEMEIISQHSNWAEQDPDVWWDYLCIATQRAIKAAKIKAEQITGIGIAYQMHGLVIVNKEGTPLRNAIIWCDSRAIEIGNKAFDKIGKEKCAEHLLNSPGNFTASKLKWVKDNEPKIYEEIHKYMLPGDYIAYKLTGKINTTKSGLSEGMLWDYKNEKVADFLLNYYGIDKSLTPEIINNFTDQGHLHSKASAETGLPLDIPVVYRAGDQPNNALSLNVFNPGEVAATGGTSGVIYAVTDSIESKETSRINNFAHVNYSKQNINIGKLLCINGCGIMYRWLRNNMGVDSFEEMNDKASNISVGSDGVIVIPFGNGAERMLNNKDTGVHFANLNLNIHNKAHLCRATLEGIAFAFVYGMEILKNDNAKIDVIRAGNDNLFRSEVFAHTVATLIGDKIEIYDTTGSTGAARAVGLRNDNLEKFKDIIKSDYIKSFVPQENRKAYTNAYNNWKRELEIRLKSQ